VGDEGANPNSLLQMAKPQTPLAFFGLFDKMGAILKMFLTI